ncbi:phosphoadenylyl-sulfate reductase [Oceanomicrobium pacificus]|uniref:Adenosine 5'-phosphosulfate reductase n=1 Tax=Oceanomicrobium pacificus TaxID=2692916 RepID=A0A6B0TJG6_9RHOB|nr:phosphoadenylyl-sulfate reductase [Oceanomicrobium pacificus]MXU64567.1 phosphoadenylyl-sulfate reductase [Oceanomicrobium pacificus]
MPRDTQLETPVADRVAALNLKAKEETALQRLDEVLNGNAVGRVALVSSFGAESAVLLHLASRLRKDVPVIFVDTRMLFQETLDYQLELAEAFGLTDIRRITPDSEAVRRDDVFGRLHLKDTDACCALRKVAPLDAALDGFDAWITGRKRHQTDARRNMDLFEDENGRRIKVNPLAFWQPEDLRAYMDAHDLPRHPLTRRGFASIGCAPCTRPVAEGEDPRAGRWAGSDKTECGIHFDENGKVVRPAA